MDGYGGQMLARTECETEWSDYTPREMGRGGGGGGSSPKPKVVPKETPQNTKPLYCSLFRDGKGVAGIGLATSGSTPKVPGVLGGFSGSISGGVLIDGKWNVSAFFTFGGGRSIGSGSVNGGLNVLGSNNATSVNDMAGPFSSQSGNIGPANAETFQGTGANGQLDGSKNRWKLGA